MFRGKNITRILAGVLMGAIIGSPAAAANIPQLTEETVLEQLHQIECHNTKQTHSAKKGVRLFSDGWILETTPHQ